MALHKGFVVCDQNSIDRETEERLEEMGYVVIRKHPGTEVEFWCNEDD